MGFEEAVDKVLDHEGGFVDDPADRGGMTFMGISRRWFPDEPFWEKIDALLDEGRNPNEAMGELRPDVKDFYRPCHPASHHGAGQSRRGHARGSADCVPLPAGRPLPRHLQG